MNKNLLFEKASNTWMCKKYIYYETESKLNWAALASVDAVPDWSWTDFGAACGDGVCEAVYSEEELIKK